MGLDIALRYRRASAQPIGTYCDQPDYAKGDIEEMNENQYSFSGRAEFSVVREWVGDERYGKWIPLVGDDYTALLNSIMAELERRGKEQPEFYGELPYFNNYGLGSLLGIIVRAPIVERAGWILEIECDW